MLKSLKDNQSGFTLTEVLIGIMILTVAIVSATNLLVGLIQTNQNNVVTLQAYYLAQEGVEGVRNIRDTNWMHNADFKGNDYLYGVFDYGKSYSIRPLSSGWQNSSWRELQDKSELRAFLPWEIYAFDTEFLDKYNSAFKVDENFYRHVDILNPCEEGADIAQADCKNFMLVRSVVNFENAGVEREVIIENLLSNWKDGAI